MRAVALSFVLPVLAIPVAAAQESNIYKDWIIGCDNLRTCTALGLPNEDGGGAYVKITRSGEASAEPAVEFALYSETGKEGAKMVLALNDPSLGGLPADPLPTVFDGEFFRGRLAGPAARDFIAAALKDTSLSVALVGDSDPPSVVSLSGATAALLAVDDNQKRVGTTTALTRVGAADPSTIPPVPPEPVVKAVMMRDLSEKLPPFPTGISKPGADTGCPDDSVMAVRLSGVLTLWGVCESAGAYNYSYGFWLVEDGTLKPALFELPESLGGSVEGLTNPYVSDDGLTLSEFDKGRGIGDCGVDASWAWDGTGFRLVKYAASDDCRGVLPDDWPVLYRARVE